MSIDATKLTSEDRDKLLLGMGASIIDLCGAVNDLTAAVQMLLTIVTTGIREGATA